MKVGGFRTPVAAVGLVVCLAIALSIFVPGCRHPEPAPPPVAGTEPPPAQPSPDGTGIPVPPGAAWLISERLNPDAPGLALGDGVIPFLVADPRPVARERQDILLGYWDLGAGTVTFDPVPVCTVEVDTLRLVWDGGARLGLMVEPPQVPGNPSPLFALDLMRAGADGLVACPWGEPGIYLLTTGFLDALSGTEGDPANRRYPMASCRRAVILTAGAGRAEALLVATVGEPNSSGGLGVVRYGLEEGVLRAETPSPPLNIVEAGGHLSQWTRVGDRVYTTGSYPAGSTSLLRYWDVATGEDGDGPALEPRLEAYETDCALEMDYPGASLSLWLPGPPHRRVPARSSASRPTSRSWSP